MASARRAAWWAAAAAVCLSAAVGAQPARDRAVTALGPRVEAWERELGSVVADETYEQTVIRLPRSGSVRRPDRPPRESRLLQSEFTLVHFDDGPNAWLGFRDVLRVDGVAAPAAVPSIGQIMNDSSLGWQARWERVRDRNAVFNLGTIARDLNLPTFALAALRATTQPRFVYTNPRVETAAGQQLTVVDFRERARPTLVSGFRGRDVVLAGTVWFDPAQGRVRRTEIRVRDRVSVPAEVAADNLGGDVDLSSRITVEFGPDTNVGTWVPLEMRERYDNAWGETTTGRATYTNYRRFRTSGRIVPPGA